MLGNPRWFQRRKYGGWGITPRTWQGWAYFAALILPFIVFQSLPFWSTEVRLVVTAAWLLIVLVDVVHIMRNMGKDERESRIEAIAERNAAWAMVGVVTAGALYQLITSSLEGAPWVDPFLAIALFAGLTVKSASNIILERRGV